MKHHKKNSKRQKLSLKYNIQKRVRVTKRRLRKEAKKAGIRTGGLKRKKDPGIPNTWPFKAEMLAELEKQKERKEEELLKKKLEAKKKSEKDQKKEQAEKRRMLKDRDEERRQKRAEDVEESQAVALMKVLLTADTILEVLDARDPVGCRCAELETWALDNGKKLMFVLTKTDLVAPQLVARWLQALGHEAPTVAVQCEAGREGVPELLRMLGCAPKGQESPIPAPKAVGVVGYLATGKTTLCKAMRQESRQAVAKWLMDSPGRLRPPSDVPHDVRGALHCLQRGLTPKGAAWSGATATAASSDEAGPLAVVAHLLERSDSATLMRRFRLHAFSGAEEMLRAYAKDRNLKSKKGKEMAPEAVARRMLAELDKAPAAWCVPHADNACVAAKERAQLVLWKPHETANTAAALRALMAAQLKTLVERPQGPAGGVQLSSVGGAGPSVNIQAIVAGEGTQKAAAGGGDDNAMESGSEGWESMDGEDCEEEEGLESEDADMDDE
eukprot:TRINITY_DN56790_c0_g1_i1.p1 TRINITY_DN56790_c0_g1~~TRINITY_DN56790_c0_g1_i1.p1  ORF type:complete len:529 (+),score=144.71 TRINITY_DN56790_c0_g1_i1:93-1589(+)